MNSLFKEPQGREDAKKGLFSAIFFCLKPRERIPKEIAGLHFNISTKRSFFRIFQENLLLFKVYLKTF